MELDIHRLSVAHQRDKIIKIFDNANECLRFCEDMKKTFKIKIASDPLYAFLIQVKNKGHFEGFKEGEKDSGWD